MRTNKILKAFCLSAALLMASLTASQAMAACLYVYPNAFFCQGWVSGSPGGKLDGPLSGTGEIQICAANTPTNVCVESVGLITFHYANGSTDTVNFTDIVGASPGCVAASPEAGTPENCSTSFSDTIANMNSQCTASKKPAACCTGAGKGTCESYPTGTLTNLVCTGPSKPFTCCTGANTGTCDPICVNVTNAACTGAGAPYLCCTGTGTGTCTDSCPSGNNCMDLAAFAALKYTVAGSVAEYASDVDGSGVGFYALGNDLAGNVNSDLTGCNLWVQFSANTAITVFTFLPTTPLSGSCGLAGTSITMRCQGFPQF